ncbi:CPSF A subunit region-domain-containing protein [Melampsora americana]|nr:CPSF A subunit region-domain-containing protein [Melampsora americana]
MNSFYRQHLRPSGVQFSTQISITPSTSRKSNHHHQYPNYKVITNLIIARSSYLQLFDVCQSTLTNEFKVFHVLEHQLHGIVTGLQPITTIDTPLDGLDRLLVSFKDAKITLLEWSHQKSDLVPISLHTFEKLPQITQGDFPTIYDQLETDPQSRCAILKLPQSTIAVLPFFQENNLDLETLFSNSNPSANNQRIQSFPYAPSFIIDLNQSQSFKSQTQTQTHSQTQTQQKLIKSIISFKFLPGFSQPTLAVLYTYQHTWAGRLENTTDSCSLIFITLDLSSNHFTIIFQIDNLPYHAHSVIACPKEVGGVLVICADMILHIDQSSKLIGIATNGWSKLSTQLDVPTQQMIKIVSEDGQDQEERLKVRLENSKLVFVTIDRALMFLTDGQIFRLCLYQDGRTLIKLCLEKFPVISVIPSVVVKISDHSVFVGSMLSDSMVMGIEFEGEKEVEIVEEVEVEAVHQNGNDMEIDQAEEDEIYGKDEPDDKKTKDQDGLESITKATKKKIHREIRSLKLHDSISGHGPIRDFTMSKIGGLEDSFEMVACTGSGETGGLTIFYREMPLMKRKKLDSTNESMKITNLNSIAFNDPTGSPECELAWISIHDRTKIFSLIKNPEEGNRTSDLKFMKTLNSSTIYVAMFFDQTCFLQITSYEIKLLKVVGFGEVQMIRPTETEDKKIKIIRAKVIQDYILLEASDHRVMLYQGQMDSLTINRIQLPHLPKPVTYASLCSAYLPLNDQEEQTNGSSSKNDEDVEKPWLFLTDLGGDLHILSLPELEIVFTVKGIENLPDLLNEDEDDEQQQPHENEYEHQDGDVKMEEDEKVEGRENSSIQMIYGFATGAKVARPHLYVELKNGALAVYQISIAYDRKSTDSLNLKTKPKALSIRLNKVLGYQYESSEPIPNLDRRVKVVKKHATFSGIHLSGPEPVWIVSTDHGPVQVYKAKPNQTITYLDQSDKFLVSDHQVEIWESEIGEGVCLDGRIPVRLVKDGRSFSKIVYEPKMDVVVGASYLVTPFANFTEEGVMMWEQDDESKVRPNGFRSSLELILPGSWDTIDGHEFQQNEWVTSMKLVSLDSKSKRSGRREFIGAGTTCNRAEDLAARGGVYVFEVIEIVPDPKHPERNRGLRLRYHETTKACVTAVDGLNGYFIHTMGQKLYAKCFEQDERLLAVGFLDIRPYTTTLKVLKNFIVLGDAVKGITLVAFQEEPYKLIELGHTFVDLRCSTIDFLVLENKLSIVTSDLDGTIRIFEYNPTNIESQGGLKLLCRTEFGTAGEMGSSLGFGKRLSSKEEARAIGTLFAGLDGSISSLVPVKEAVFKRLQIVQTRLIRHLDHFAGLNPRGFRTVRNDLVSRAMNRGIVDGEIIERFGTLTIDQQDSIGLLAGSDRNTILINLNNLKGIW